jgi:sec-independent protein translocase protein TatB
MNLFGIGPLELMLIAVIALIVFGPARLPEIMGNIGRAVAEFRKVTGELSSEFNRTIQAEIDQTRAVVDSTRAVVQGTSPPPAPQRVAEPAPVGAAAAGPNGVSASSPPPAPASPPTPPTPVPSWAWEAGSGPAPASDPPRGRPSGVGRPSARSDDLLPPY